MTALWERLVEIFPELSHRLDQLRLNRHRYRIIADTGKTADQVVSRAGVAPDGAPYGLAVGVVQEGCWTTYPATGRLGAEGDGGG